MGRLGKVLCQIEFSSEVDPVASLDHFSATKGVFSHLKPLKVLMNTFYVFLVIISIHLQGIIAGD